MSKQDNNSSIRKFLDHLVLSKNISGQTPEIRRNLVSQLEKVLLRQINLAVINAMPDDKLDELEQGLYYYGVTDDQIRQLVVDSGIDTGKIAYEVMMKFKDYYLGTSETRQVTYE